MCLRNKLKVTVGTLGNDVIKKLKDVSCEYPLPVCPVSTRRQVIRCFSKIHLIVIKWNFTYNYNSCILFYVYGIKSHNYRQRQGIKSHYYRQGHGIKPNNYRQGTSLHSTRHVIHENEYLLLQTGQLLTYGSL